MRSRAPDQDLISADFGSELLRVEVEARAALSLL
jgi:hypothetical protein